MFRHPPGHDGFCMTCPGAFPGKRRKSGVGLNLVPFLFQDVSFKGQPINDHGKSSSPKAYCQDQAL